MAKKKKTRKQKVLSDLRHPHIAKSSDSSVFEPHDVTPSTSRSDLYSFNLESSNQKTIAKTLHYTGTDYRYIIHDLKKTAILTISIIAGQIILYLLINSLS